MQAVINEGVEIEKERHASTTNLIRNTITNITSSREILPLHLYTLAYESSPQRIWQAFLGQRHILVTSWAKSGIYDLDFGFGHSLPRYVHGDLPVADGFVCVKEAPPPLPPAGLAGSGEGPIGIKEEEKNKEKCRASWTENGVDVTVCLKREDMERLLNDSLLLPVVGMS